MRRLPTSPDDLQARTTAWRIALAMALLCSAGASAVSAQSVSKPRRPELSIGGGLLGGSHLGEQPADLRAGGTGGAFRLFDSDTEFAPTGMLEARVGVALTRRFGVEARAALSQPELRTSVSDDFEGAPDATLVERVGQLMIDGGVLVRLDELKVYGWTPFATGGAGYVQFVHEGLTFADDGRLFYVGGGLARGFRERPDSRLEALGFRADVRVSFVSGDNSIDDSTRPQTSASGSVVVVF